MNLRGYFFVYVGLAGFASAQIPKLSFMVVARDPAKPVAQIRVDDFFATTPTAGVPYSAEVHESHEGLAFEMPATGPFIARDAQGRMREDHTYPVGPQGNVVTIQLIQILDPVEGYHYLLDPKAKVAYRMKYQGGVPKRPAPPSKPQIGRKTTIQEPDGAVMVVESLGTRVFETMEAEGTRTTTTVPDPLPPNLTRKAEVREEWRVPGLAVAVLTDTKRADAHSVIQLTKLSANPPAELFYIPTDYRIEDEPSPRFEITIGPLPPLPGAGGPPAQSIPPAQTMTSGAPLSGGGSFPPAISGGPMSSVTGGPSPAADGGPFPGIGPTTGRPLPPPANAVPPDPRPPGVLSAVGSKGHLYVDAAGHSWGEYSAHIQPLMQVVKDAPFSGLQYEPSNAPAGNIVFEGPMPIYRDLEGRTRIEHPTSNVRPDPNAAPHLIPSDGAAQGGLEGRGGPSPRPEAMASTGEAAKQPEPADPQKRDDWLAEINDPVAGYFYLLCFPQKVAYRLKYDPTLPPPAANILGLPLPQRPPQASAGFPQPAAPQGSLPSKLIDGVPVENEGSGAIEQWREPKTGVLIEMALGLGGQRRLMMMVKNFSLVEPNPALFRPPDGWEIRDVEDTFTIQTPPPPGAKPVRSIGYSSSGVNRAGPLPSLPASRPPNGNR